MGVCVRKERFACEGEVRLEEMRLWKKQGPQVRFGNGEASVLSRLYNCWMPGGKTGISRYRTQPIARFASFSYVLVPLQDFLEQAFERPMCILCFVAIIDRRRFHQG